MLSYRKQGVKRWIASACAEAAEAFKFNSAEQGRLQTHILIPN